MPRSWAAVALAILATLTIAQSSSAQTSTRGDTYKITRAAGPIVIDGRLDDEGWRGAVKVERWYEINPGDNTEPKVKSVGYLTYDDRFFYVGFDFEDPDPKAILAPFGDHDQIQSNADFGGLFLDPRNDGHTAYEFQVTAHNIQFDAVMDDNGGGENGSPDFFWDSATHIDDRGWTLEIRIPFASIRYRNVDPQTWGVMLWRNYAREFRYQFTSSRHPRGSQCFVCRENVLTGLERLPSGGHLIAAPYVSAVQAAKPADGLGTRLQSDPLDHRIGADVKYIPNADNVVDATVRPDFSQIESDTAQISSNQRFALFYPEKRPFFLEGVELLSTPIQAVYTRTITDPQWGGRATGKIGGVNYTALLGHDEGGGSVVVPGPNFSSFAPQDFHSTVFIGRARKDLNALSFVSLLMTDRDASDAHNRVFGPDFQWRAHGTETISGQWLVSDTRNPNRPDLHPTWTGQSFTSSGAQLQWNHSTTHYDAGATYKDFGDGFRAEMGFVPQVGYREVYAETGRTFRPTGVVSRVRTFLQADSQVERDGGALIDHFVQPGVEIDTRYSGYFQTRYFHDRVRAGSSTFPRHQVVFVARFSPTRMFQQLGVDGYVGQDVDFANERRGHGALVNVSGTINATNHLVFDLIANTQRLHPSGGVTDDRTVFTARVWRAKGTYTFTARSFVRVIAQYIETTRDRELFAFPTSSRDAQLTGTLLLAYKINWQSVMFVGYGDDREYTPQRQLTPGGHQVFVKLSYAFQR
jgi:hypothetical protein